MPSQFLHLGSYGRAPRKKEKRWACIEGVCAEGARLPGARRHIPIPAQPHLLHGISPVQAGRIAEERANQAYDATGKRRLRRDGVALLAGVVSYPIPRAQVQKDPVEQDKYCAWRQATLDWLLRHFGANLLSVVEHWDEDFSHLHFYVVPTLDERNRLNVNCLHPGRYAKAVALAEGADKKNGERSYRKGMRAFQDDYHREVSAGFGHDRYGPRRARVSRRERETQKRTEEERKRMIQEINQKAVETENAARRRGWERYAQPFARLQAAHAAEQARRQQAEAAFGAETARRREAEARRRQAEAEVAALRQRLAELEAEAPRFAA